MNGNILLDTIYCKQNIKHNSVNVTNWTFMGWTRKTCSPPSKFTRNTTEAAWRTCARVKKTSHKPFSNDWLVLCVRDANMSLLQEVVIHVTEARKLLYCMTISVYTWFVLIMVLINFVDIALFVIFIWI